MALDLVQIGFEVQAKGLDSANKQVDALIDKVGAVGDTGKKAATDFAASQRKIVVSATSTGNAILTTSDKMLKRQENLNKLLPFMDKQTASLAASFSVVTDEVADLERFIGSLGATKAFEKVRKDAALLAKQQEQNNKLVQDTLNKYELLSRKSFGNGILDSLSKQNKGLAEINKQYADVEKSQARQSQEVNKIIGQYEKLSNRSFGNGILDSVGAQNKGLSELNKQYADIENSQARQSKEVAKIVSQYESLSAKPLGGGILDTIDQQSKGMKELVNHYKDLEQADNNYAKTVEANRQKEMKARQDAYHKSLEDEEKRRVAEMKTRQAEYQKSMAANQGQAKINPLDSNTKALKDLTDKADKAKTSHKSLVSTLGNIAKFAVLSTAVYAVINALQSLSTSFITTADDMQNLTQRISLYTPKGIAVADVFERLGKAAKENRVGLSDTGKLYTQLLPPIQRIKGGVNEVLGVVDAFGKAMLIGGVNTREAAAATTQFGQAMASGKLAGDEFRSLAEASPRLLQAISDGAGIAAEKLKEMSAAGKLTSGLVSGALLDQQIQLQLEAAKMGQTVAGAFNESMVEYQNFVKTVNEETGMTDGIVAMIRSVTDAAVEFGNAMLNSFTSSTGGLHELVNLLEVVWDISTLIPNALMDILGYIVKNGEETSVWGFIFSTVKDVLITIVDTIFKIPAALLIVGTTITQYVLAPFQKLMQLAAKGLEMAGMAQAAELMNQSIESTNKSLSDFAGDQEKILFGFNLLNLGVDQTTTSLTAGKDLLAEWDKKIQDLNVRQITTKALTDDVARAELAVLLIKQKGLIVGGLEHKQLKARIDEYYRITQQQAAQAKAEGARQAAQAKAEADAKKAAEKMLRQKEAERKKILSIKEGYEDQIAYANRLQDLLAAGESLDAAKIAAEKDYVKVYGDSVKAREVAEAQRKVATLEYLRGLDEEEDIQGRIAKLIAAGASYEAAREAAVANLGDSEQGRLATAQAMANTLFAQGLQTADQLDYQSRLNSELERGVSFENAHLRATMERIRKLQGGKLTEEQQRANTINERALRLAQIKTEVLKSNAELDRKSSIYQAVLASGADRHAIAIAKIKAENEGISDQLAEQTLTSETENALRLRKLQDQTEINSLLAGEDELIRNIRESLVGISVEEERSLYQNQKLLEVLKKQAEAKEQKKQNPLGDFTNVDFAVLGSLGDPFKEAVLGASEYLAKMSTIEEELGYVVEKQAELRASKENFKGDKASKEYNKILDDILELTRVEDDYYKQKKEAQSEAFVTGVKSTKAMFSENSKIYKALTGIEKAFTAFKIAQGAKRFLISMGFINAETGAYVAGSVTKKVAELGFTAFTVVQKGIQAAASGVAALASSMAGLPFPLNVAAFAATAGLLASIGLNLAGGGSSGSYASFENKGTGTVFGDPEAESKSIQNSIELLADNSDVMLPLTNAMLKSLRNIENNIGGLTNLLIRNAPAEGLAAGLGSDWKLGSFSQMSVKVTEGVVDFLTLGLDKLLLGGAIGNLLGGIVGTIMGGLFGKTKSEVTASGLFGANQELGNILENGFQLKEYADVKTTKKSWFSSSTSYSTKFAKANPELERQFTLIFSNIYNSMMSATNALGFDLDKVASKLSDHVVKLGKINLKGLKGEEIQERLTAVFGAASDEIARAATNEVKYITTQVQVPVKSLFGRLTGKTKTITQTQTVITNVFDDFQKVGEGFFETIVRVATGVEQAAKLTDRLFVSSIDYRDIINKQGDVATEIVRQSVLLAEGMKGIEGGFYDLVDTFDGTASELVDFILTLRDLQDAVYATGKNGDYLTSSMFAGAGGLSRLQDGLDTYFEMMSPMEQATELTRRMTNEFAKLGLQLPSDIKAYRNLVSSIDISSSAGQKLYGQVIALAPEFMDLQDSLESANSAVNELVKSLRDLAEEARKARGETQQPRNLAAIRAEFDSTAALAMQGDMTAAQKLLTLGKDLMQVSKQYSVSGSEYAKDLATIQKVATVSADVQELGLGYTPTTSLTPLASAGTQTVETVNSTTDAKLEALRADLITAITAVAKYTQDTAQRLQRWDYGDKMNVHVEQEVGDAPIKVQTV